MQVYILFGILIATLTLFIWGYWRYDIVALIALAACVAVGVVPYTRAFVGFINPAVITVATVMIITQAISRSGVIDFVVKKLTPVTTHAILHVATLITLAAILSAFMNNVGALALLMPIAIQTSFKSKRSPSMILMPLAFGSALGGLCTVIGTPPNLLISTYRQQITGHAFAMFDFTPVGLLVAICGVVFIALIGWRLIPTKRKAPKRTEDLFHIQDYITEIKIPPSSPVVESTVRELENLIEGDFTIVAMIRNNTKQIVTYPNKRLHAEDILIIEANHDDLRKLLNAGKLELVGEEKVLTEELRSKDIMLIEAVVPQASRIEGRSAQSMRLRSRYRLNLLALAREGRPFKERLNHVKFKAGDIVLLQGDSETAVENVASLGFLPLLERGVHVNRGKAYIPLLIFAVAILCAAFQLMPVEIAFGGGVLAMVLSNSIPHRLLYESIDWSIICLLGAMIPIGNALQSTGGTELIANTFLHVAGNLPPYASLGLLMLITMTLSDIMNNAATAVIMGPIAVSIANALHHSIDPFLMAVAVAASCSFLTPIGHQNNTLVMGPGGYRFSDYFRLGLPLEIIVLLTGVPLILWFWPL